MHHRNQQDETLVMLTLAGEETAYEALVTRYQKAVVTAAASITKNHFMAEDAAQDAFVTAWMKLNTLQEPQKFGAWVCRIAKNCALNMVGRYRSFLPLDVVDNVNVFADADSNPAELYALSEEREEVNKSIEALPEKVKQIIHLHYFEGLSIVEIADRLRISEGTVKWQLHDGRKRIRKELCAMNEKYSDTLVERVMKKVEELKLWQFKNDKSGFEKVYKEVLREVEELPECQQKQHALADVLMRGWWWLPGKKNDALFARIAKAAMDGKNEEVMTFIVTREDNKVYGSARINFIREKQIPRLEAAGFVKTLGREWFLLGYHLLKEGKIEEGIAAYNKVEEILQKGDLFYTVIPYARKMHEEVSIRYKKANKERYSIHALAEEYRNINGKLRYWGSDGVSAGYLGSYDAQSLQIFINATRCDGQFFADISIGETYVGTDGTKLSYISNNESVETPAGKFDDCQVWEIRRWTHNQKIVCRTYYKDGIGIVRQDHTTDGVTETHLLKSYNVKNSLGLIPMDEGNHWEYESLQDSSFIAQENCFSVAFANDEKVMLAHWSNVERIKYDENNWFDMVQQIANDYVFSSKDGKEGIFDVTPAIERAEQLAVTPMQKAHTKAAASTIRRIMATDPTFNPDHTATGHWNFFGREYIRQKRDTLCVTGYNCRWSFEWKNMGGYSPADTPLLYSDIFGILQDATNSVWSDEWRIGAAPVVEYMHWETPIKTQITCEDGGTITTKAGTFENCFKLCFDVEGMEGGLSYRSGKKAYYFAEGIGIVRTENEYCGGAKTAIYELTSYTGTGKGMMPFENGMTRRYDALNLTDGFVGAVEYEYVTDEDGDIVVFSNQIGIREVPPPITQYAAIEGEQIEDRLWDSGKWKASHAKNGANNFHLILHLLARPSRNRNNAKRSISINGFNVDLVALLGENGEIPPAWYGVYTYRALVKAAALFGDGQKEDGYAALELAVSHCEKSAKFKMGDLLDTGNTELFGGAKLIWGEELIQLPDGSKEPIAYGWEVEYGASSAYYAMTTLRGWEWFNPVREEPRFKEYVERVHKIINKD